MAVTRNFLKGMGLTEEQVGAIIDEHVDTTNALKADRDKYKAEAEKLTEVQKELDDLKAKGDDGWQAKYEKEHSDFEAYKNEQIAKESRATKEAAYTALLKEANISEKAYKLILNATDFLERPAENGASFNTRAAKAQRSSRKQTRKVCKLKQIPLFNRQQLATLCGISRKLVTHRIRP